MRQRIFGAAWGQLFEQALFSPNAVALGAQPLGPIVGKEGCGDKDEGENRHIRKTTHECKPPNKMAKSRAG